MTPPRGGPNEHLEKKVEDHEDRIRKLERMKSPDPVNQAREVLLRRYTEQSISHAAILLTIALVIFAAPRAWELLKWDFFNIPTFVAAIPVTIWQVFRFLFYGRMAGHIMHLKPQPLDDLGKWMRPDQREISIDQLSNEQKWNAKYFKHSEPTHMYALQQCAETFDKKHSAKQYYLAHPWSWETRKKRPEVLILYTLIALLAYHILIWQFIELVGPIFWFLGISAGTILWAWLLHRYIKGSNGSKARETRNRDNTSATQGTS